MKNDIKVCPRCGSTNIGVEASATAWDFCKSCGFGKIGSAPDLKVYNFMGQFPTVKRKKKS